MHTIIRCLLLLCISVIFKAVKVTQFKQKHPQYFQTFPVNKTPAYAATLTEDDLQQTFGTPMIGVLLWVTYKKQCQTVLSTQNLPEPPNNTTHPSFKSGHLLYTIQNNN